MGKKLIGKACRFPVFKRKRERKRPTLLVEPIEHGAGSTLDALRRVRGTVTAPKFGDLRVQGEQWPSRHIFLATMALKARQWFLSMRLEDEPFP